MRRYAQANLFIVQDRLWPTVAVAGKGKFDPNRPSVERLAVLHMTLPNGCVFTQLAGPSGDARDRASSNTGIRLRALRIRGQQLELASVLERQPQLCCR